jgi:hypothetical protein
MSKGKLVSVNKHKRKYYIMIAAKNLHNIIYSNKALDFQIKVHQKNKKLLKVNSLLHKIQ